jgi:hypothetical protein
VSEAPEQPQPSAPPATRRAYVHVGAPKTGSTFLQGLFWRNRAALLSEGLEVLGDNQGQHYRAGKDVRGMPFDANDPGVDWTGAWEDMAQRAATSASAAVVVSDEHLASLTSDQCRRVAASLAPRELHVVYVVRDLAGLLPSEWQEYVKHGSTLTFEDWSRRVLERPRSGEARWFWSVHDPLSVVARWAEATDAHRVHVIAMPPRDAPRDELWRRFAGVVGVDPQVVRDLEAPGNTSLGLAAVEVLRRVNAALPPDLPRWHRTGVVRDVLANQVLNPLGGEGRPSLPDDLARLVEQRARRTWERLPSTGCDIVGSLPPPRGAVAGDPPPDDAQVAEVAVAALAAMAARVGTMRDDRRAAERRLHEQHARHLAEVEQSFWDQHPLALRSQRVKERVVGAEADHPLLARTMDGYRWARRAVRGEPSP